MDRLRITGVRIVGEAACFHCAGKARRDKTFLLHPGNICGRCYRTFFNAEPDCCTVCGNRTRGALCQFCRERHGYPATRLTDRRTAYIKPDWLEEQHNEHEMYAQRDKRKWIRLRQWRKERRAVPKRREGVE